MDNSIPSTLLTTLPCPVRLHVHCLLPCPALPCETPCTLLTTLPCHVGLHVHCLLPCPAMWNTMYIAYYPVLPCETPCTLLTTLPCHVGHVHCLLPCSALWDMYIAYYPALPCGTPCTPRQPMLFTCVLRLRISTSRVSWAMGCLRLGMVFTNILISVSTPKPSGIKTIS